MTEMRYYWVVGAAVLAVFGVTFWATMWALNHGHLRWVVTGCGVVLVALAVLLHRALKGTWW